LTPIELTGGFCSRRSPKFPDPERAISTALFAASIEGCATLVTTK
jgi:hypothetical protein